MREVKKQKGRVLSILLTVCMLAGLLPADMLGGVASVKAEETTKTYVLDGDELTLQSSDQTANFTCGTEDYFTVLCTANKKAKICAISSVTTGSDPNKVACYENLNWTDSDLTERTNALRIAGGGLGVDSKTTKVANAVKITTQNANAQVLVYYSPKGTTARQMKVVKATEDDSALGATVGDGTYGTSVDCTKMGKAEITLADAGSYYIGFDGDGGIIPYMTVTETVASTEEPITPTPDKPGDEDGFVNGLEASAVEEGKSYYYDFTNVGAIPNSYNQGLFSFNAGSYNGASYKDTTYGIEFKSGNKLTFPVAGNSFIVVGGDNNNTCTDLTASSGTGIFVKASQTTVTAGHATLDDCKTKGTNTIVYEYQGTAGNVTLTLDPAYTRAEGETSTKAYIAYVCVIPVKDGEGTEIPAGPTDPSVATRSVTYDFTANSGKAEPAVNSILDGTNTVTSGILYMNKGSGSGCGFDDTVLRFRNGVILYLPIKDDTTKVEYSATYTGSNAGRPTYIGSTESGYTMEMSTSAAPVVIDDITDYIKEVNGKKYLSITSGGDIKIYTITLKEYNPINQVEVSGTVSNAAANGVTEIRFKNLDNENAALVTATIGADGAYHATLRRVAGNTNYVASISAAGYKIDNTDDAHKFTLTGNDATATQNFTVVEAAITNIAGTLTGVPDSALTGGALKAELVPADTALDKVELTLTKTGDGTYTFASAALEPEMSYTVELTNADDYEVTAPLTKAAGTYTDVAIAATPKALVKVSGAFVTSDKKASGVSKITFTNMDTPAYKYTFDVTGENYTANLRAGEYETSVVANEGYEAFDHVSVGATAVTNDVYLQAAPDTSAVAYQAEIKVGEGQQFEKIADAVAYIARMTRGESDRVTIDLTDELYREQLVINTPNVTIKGNGATITWYYGVGFSYYSAKPIDARTIYYDEAYAVDKYGKETIAQNPGHWGATVNLLAGAKGFQAENLTFENSLNRYLTEEELADGAAANVAAGVTNRTTSNIDVRAKASKERACVLYIQADDTEYKDCKFLSSQDTLYTGDDNENSYFVNCVLEGTTDYICGDGNPVFDKCTLSMYSYSDQNATGSFIVASKAKGKHGYLFKDCKVVTTSDAGLKPTSQNYLARAWDKGIVVYYNTEVESAGIICDKAYTDMNAKVTEAKYFEYNTHTPDGTAIDTSKRADGVTKMTDADAANVVLEDYFDGWNPEYYEAEDDEDDLVVSKDPDASSPVSEVETEGTIEFKDGETAVTGNVEIKAVAQDDASAEINTKVEQIKADAATAGQEVKAVLYYDISAYLVKDGVEKEVALTSGAIRIKLQYPEGFGSQNGIIVMHETDVPETLTEKDKETDGFWITADSFSSFTVVFTAAASTQPVDPTPVDPKPEDPTPVDPTPVDPKPEDPKPVDPKPVDPSPVTPGSSDDDDNDGGAAEVIEEIAWEKVAAQIDDAAKSKAPKNLDVTSGDRYEVPVSVLGKIAGTKTTLALHAGDGITLSISGTDVKKATAPLKMALSHGNAIPAGAANQVLATAQASKSFSMEDKAAYPFRMHVHVNLGKENAGKTAYLYYFDEKSGTMVLSGSFTITASGQAMFAIYRGDEYIIVVSDKPAALKGKYVVQKGDSLSRIAGKSGVTLKKLVEVNPQIKNTNLIVPGQQINLP